MIPFPTASLIIYRYPSSDNITLTAYKVRFNGYGPSDYDYSSLVPPRIPDDPLYQPKASAITAAPLQT